MVVGGCHDDASINTPDLLEAVGNTKIAEALALYFVKRFVYITRVFAFHPLIYVIQVISLPAECSTHCNLVIHITSSLIMGSPDRQHNHDDSQNDIDIEKRARHSLDSSDDDECSSTSSQYSMHSNTRILSSQYSSHDPILGEYEPRRRERSQPRVRFPIFRQIACVCTPRKFTRYFTLILVITIGAFLFTLVKLSLNSAQSVSLGLHKAKAPPPTWVKFPFLQRYHSGVRSLVASKDNVPEYPEILLPPRSKDKDAAEANDKDHSLPDSIPFPAAETGPIGVAECFLDEERKIRIPDVRAFEGLPSGMPSSVMGSHAQIGLREDVCFERFGRLGPYGLGYSKNKGGSGAGMDGDREGIESIWAGSSQVDFRKVNWKKAQSLCLDANEKRFRIGASHRDLQKRQLGSGSSLVSNEGLVPRKAVIIRTWNDYQYDDEDLFYLRSLMWELSLQTGSEYTVHFLIHVRNNELPIWADETIYQQVLKASLPAEFEGMGTLWSEKQMEMVYSALPQNYFRDLPLHGVYRSLHMPLTWFAHQHPEFAHFWHFEMDMRYTGHFHHFVSRVEQWAAKQPRKGLWERNARFYVPSEHGSWGDFTHMVRVQTEHGTSTKSNLFSNLINNPSIPDSIRNEMTSKAEKAVWGPEPPLNDIMDNLTDVFPPHSMAQDKGEWGVDEEADLIVFNPLFDPDATNWNLAADTTGYNTSGGLPPRRAAVTTFGRYSKRLLDRMHRDMAIHSKHMFTEMFPASTALHHGYKAVYVPHPVYIDRKWPTDFLAATFNGGRNGQAGGSRLSVFSEEREHNFLGTTWYYNAGFAPNLWHRWLGYKVDNDGGEAEEMAGEGRMCLPAMLLHPIKQVNLIYQENGEEEDGK